MKKIVISFATLAVATAAMLITVSQTDTYSLLEMNIEALSRTESNTKYDPIWFVSYVDPIAITCTPGGTCVCL